MFSLIRWQLRLFILLTLLVWILSGSSAFAQTSCGNIIGPDNIFNQSNIVTVPIQDCVDPFKLTTDPASPYTLKITGTDVADGGSVVVAELIVEDIAIEGESYLSTYTNLLYKHEGEDYVFIDYGAVIGVGTYTMLIVDYELILSKRSLMERLREAILPTTYAQSPGRYTYAVTFTLTEPLPEPTGASSVLFLPGIQASRLYKDGVLGTEDQVWEPNINNDVAQLEMTSDGFSVNDIYTRDVIDEILFPALGGNIYKGFLGMLDDLKEEGTIANSLAFAYDWRYGVQDIVVSGTRYENEIKSLINEVEDLDEGSFTGKVTIIGHSNGGLLAKALITELERLGDDDLVDKVVFVGVPQLGSAKAIGVLLHGLQQQKMGGLVIDDTTVRDVIENMPGVYSLLPSQKYFDLSDSPLVTSVESLDTNGISEYGDIDSLVKLSNFALDTQDLRSDNVPVHTPSTLNSQLMSDMVDGREYFDNWLAPTDIEVYEIVGTGVTTIKSLEYRNYPCINLICAFGSYAKPYPIFTKEGDETVATLSAESYGGDKVTGAVDLIREASDLFDLPENHSTLTESPTVQDFIDSIIRFPYLNETLEIPGNFIDTTRKYTIIGAHSPVQISLQDVDGKRVGIFGNQVLEEILGSQYFELGGSSYLTVPSDIEYEVTIKGTDDGVYSLTIDRLDEEDIQSNLHTYLGASTSPQMVATFKASSTGFTNIYTDLDGDASIDLEKTLDGDEVLVANDYSYELLKSEIELLSLPRIYKKLLLLQVKLAEQWGKKGRVKLESITMQNSIKTISFYGDKKLISNEQVIKLEDIINHLIN